MKYIWKCASICAFAFCLSTADVFAHSAGGENISSEQSAQTTAAAGGTSIGAGNTASAQPSGGGTAVSAQGDQALQQIQSAIALNQIQYINLMEIQMAQAAQGKLQNQDLINANQRMIQEHQAASLQVENLANSLAGC